MSDSDPYKPPKRIEEQESESSGRRPLPLGGPVSLLLTAWVYYCILSPVARFEVPVVAVAFPWFIAAVMGAISLVRGGMWNKTFGLLTLAGQFGLGFLVMLIVFKW